MIVWKGLLCFITFHFATPCWPCVCRNVLLICKGEDVNHIIVNRFNRHRIERIIIEKMSLYVLPKCSRYRRLWKITLKNNLFIECNMLENIPN